MSMRKFALAVSIVVVSSVAAGGVVAATRSSDEAALQPTRQPAGQPIEARVNHLLAQMTLEEKLEQIQLLPDFLVKEEEVRKGLGSILSVTDPKRINELQHIAVESRGCTSRCCSPSTRFTASGRSSRSRWARPARSTRRWQPTTT